MIAVYKDVAERNVLRVVTWLNEGPISSAFGQIDFEERYAGRHTKRKVWTYKEVQFSCQLEFDDSDAPKWLDFDVCPLKEWGEVSFEHAYELVRISASVFLRNCDKKVVGFTEHDSEVIVHLKDGTVGSFIVSHNEGTVIAIWCRIEPVNLQVM